MYTDRKWTQELEDAICELQQNMEIECDNYFEDIMPKAIKVLRNFLDFCI